MTLPTIPPPVSLTAAQALLALHPVLLSRALYEITTAIDFQQFEVELRQHLPQHADDIIAQNCVWTMRWLPPWFRPPPVPPGPPTPWLLPFAPFA